MSVGGGACLKEAACCWPVGGAVGGAVRVAVGRGDGGRGGEAAAVVGVKYGIEHGLKFNVSGDLGGDRGGGPSRGRRLAAARGEVASGRRRRRNIRSAVGAVGAVRASGRGGTCVENWILKARLIGPRGRLAAIRCQPRPPLALLTPARRHSGRAFCVWPFDIDTGRRRHPHRRTRHPPCTGTRWGCPSTRSASAAAEARAAARAARSSRWGR